MTAQSDTAAEALRLAEWHASEAGKYRACGMPHPAEKSHASAATLRALAAENAALRRDVADEMARAKSQRTDADAALARAEAAEARVRVLEEALLAAAGQFAFYAESHRQKQTQDGDAKAATNYEWALRCRGTALAGAAPWLTR